MYLYLGRRDRKGARVVMVLDGPETHPVRITNLKSINLPDAVFNSVEKIVYDNRMYWEPWVESAESYEVLRQNLHKRGYSDCTTEVHYFVRLSPIWQNTRLKKQWLQNGLNEQLFD
jgi:hypothetical protein